MLHDGSLEHGESIAYPEVPAPIRERILLTDISESDISMCVMGSAKIAPDAWLPLSPAVLHILLALADGELHGYAIMQEVRQSTAGAVRMGPGTLYGTIKKLLAAELVSETDGRPSKDDDERRRYYRLTENGARVLNAELARLRKVLSTARGRKWVQSAGGVS
jgi:DNA-binding PadR family transcriptional regulator